MLVTRLSPVTEVTPGQRGLHWVDTGQSVDRQQRGRVIPLIWGNTLVIYSPLTLIRPAEISDMRYFVLYQDNSLMFLVSLTIAIFTSDKKIWCPIYVCSDPNTI